MSGIRLSKIDFLLRGGEMGGAFSSHLRKVLSGALYIAKSDPRGAVHDNLLRGSQHKLVCGDATVSVRSCPRIAWITYGRCKIAV